MGFEAMGAGEADQPRAHLRYCELAGLPLGIRAHRAPLYSAALFTGFAAGRRKRSLSRFAVARSLVVM